MPIVPTPEPDSGFLTEAEGQAALALARRAVEFWVREGRRESPVGPTGGSARRAGVFVSLHQQGRLRGCIGVVESGEPLAETVIHCAIAAATQDERFRPVTREELAGLAYEVSVLAPPREIHSASEIEIGRHGLILEAGGARALLLPQVASARGWSAEVFLDQLCRKAGLPAGRWRGDARLWTFTAQVFAESPPS